MNYNRNNDGFQILGRVRRDEFIGRTAELERLVSHARRSNEGGSGEASEAAPFRSFLTLTYSIYSSLMKPLEREYIS